MSNEHSMSDEKSDGELIEEVLEQVSESDKQNDQPETDETSNELKIEANEKEVEQDRLVEEISLEMLQKQLKQAEKKATENWDKAVRAQAEMQNLQRRTQKDLENAHKYALERFAKELLAVIDSLELGIQASTSDNPEVVVLREGSALTIKQFEAVFAKFNIEAIEPEGQPFNPELHQAMTMQPSADAEPNTVLNVFQKGYVLNGRLIRPAMVVVSQAVKSAETQTDNPTESEDNKPASDSINLDEQA
ncbi:MAG: nucleotide exchange factor GrpE [Methylococcales symbiont of Hymedesmia sp. n. MRB-2018]|nr:MAG: nucleotide exchange factor GrpE [Methylococcales symbiont of Hymedesmia sp. n. MRB-2018]KAF3984570.1 MAG: nucleotide exchange factor GrpE [Methylococcales symbiont of Hymedesmia sp. n. MRB-2018]